MKESRIKWNHGAQTPLDILSLTEEQVLDIQKEQAEIGEAPVTDDYFTLAVLAWMLESTADKLVFGLIITNIYPDQNLESVSYVVKKIVEVVRDDEERMFIMQGIIMSESDLNICTIIAERLG